MSFDFIFNKILKNLFSDHLALKVLLQIMIFALFITGNGYQNVVTTFMVEPKRILPFKTVNDLLGSKYELSSNDFLNFMAQDNPKFKKAVSEGRVSKFDKIKTNHAFTMPCSEVQLSLLYGVRGMSYEKMYILPEPLSYEFLRLKVGYLNPFLNKFQRLMDLSFEAGLLSAWRTFHEMTTREAYHKEGLTATSPFFKKDILDFEQIQPIIMILLIGLGISLLALLCEIFYHDFVSKHSYFWRKYQWLKMFSRSRKRKYRVKKSSKKIKG